MVDYADRRATVIEPLAPRDVPPMSVPCGPPPPTPYQHLSTFVPLSPQPERLKEQLSEGVAAPSHVHLMYPNVYPSTYAQLNSVGRQEGNELRDCRQRVRYYFCNVKHGLICGVE